MPAKRRAREFGYRSLSPLIVDLVCYDLRSNAPHTITLQISRDCSAAQDAVDTELAIRYRPGQERNGLLVEFIQHLGTVRSFALRAENPTPFRSKPQRIMLPALISPLAEERWQELGYASFSAYITGLIRYDLLIGGPHKFDSTTASRRLQAELDAKTVETRTLRLKRKLFLDHLIERTQGKPLTVFELDQKKAHIAAELVKHLRANRP